MNPFRPWRKLVVAAGIGVGLLILVLGGLAYAAYGASQEYAGRILPGVRINGINVGGMTSDEALRAVRASVKPRLASPVRVEFEGESWSVTPRKLGVHSTAGKEVEEALEASRKASFFNRVKIGWFGDRFDFERDVSLRYPRNKAKQFIEEIATEVNTEAVDATIDYSSGWVEIAEEEDGQKVDVRASSAGLLEALKSDGSSVDLDVKTVKPEVTADSFDQILLLRIGENKLYLYDDGEITRQWKVATGQPEYPTPTGQYEVTLKRYLPTWVNPDPTGWGASMPASIPPGPGNPLGLRAINWSAAAIRFHGTSATYSLGFNASHGCVRMANEDVIELYDMIEVGTPIVSVVTGPLKPLYSNSAPDPTVVNDDNERLEEGEDDGKNKKGSN